MRRRATGLLVQLDSYQQRNRPVLRETTMRTLRYFVPVWMLVAGCSMDPEPPESTRSAGVESAPLAAQRSTYTVSSPDLTDTAVAGRARRVAEVVLGRALSDAPFQEALARTAQGRPMWDTSVESVDPELHVRYDYDSDTLVVTNRTLEFRVPSVETDPPAEESAARVVFARVVAELQQVGLISEEEYDLKHVRVGWTDYVAAARSDQEPEPRILNFRFNAQRMIGDLPFRDGHLRVAVHRSGRVASVKLRRASVRLATGSPVSTTVSLANCEARFRGTHPNAFVYFTEVAYALPDPGVHGVAEPKCVISFSEVTPQPKGEPVVARRQQARYGLADALADPVILPAHDTVPGDPRPDVP
jgi:hypothetical protein